VTPRSSCKTLKCTILQCICQTFVNLFSTDHAGFRRGHSTSHFRVDVSIRRTCTFCLCAFFDTDAYLSQTTERRPVKSTPKVQSYAELVKFPQRFCPLLLQNETTYRISKTNSDFGSPTRTFWCVCFMIHKIHLEIHNGGQTIFAQM